MKKEELFEILQNGENSVIEFKRDDIRPEQLAKEIVALANFQGGKIFLGVEDDGSISGITRSDLEEWVMNIFRDKIHPTILPYYEEWQIEDKRIAIISFPLGISKPYVVKHNGREDIYIRMGSTSCLATREQIGQLYQAGSILHTELLPIPRTDIDCLDLVRVENYLKEIINDPSIPNDKKEWEERLLDLGFLVAVSDTIFCTIAGLILFGKRPRTYFKQAGIRVMVFDSSDKEYQAKLDTVLDGALVARKEQNGQIIDNGLIERFAEIIHPFITKQDNYITEHFSRNIHYFYSLEAIRELILNSFAHRDWTRPVDIEITIYSDRLEVISPGRMTNSMNISKMKAGQRSTRNPIITEILRDYGYIDAKGMGVRRKVVPLTFSLTGKEPTFELTEDYLKTTLYKPK